MLNGKKHIHFIGIGGIGMSGLAQILLEKGYYISGSDKIQSGITKRLAGKGVQFYDSHAAKNLTNCDLVVYSSAVDQDNPERKEAVRLNIPVMRRAEVLADLMRLQWGVAVAGTHGKTTTTAMITEIAIAAGLNPTALIGGKLLSQNTNAILGEGKYIITEADEYDRSFLSLHPLIEVITNIEKDHLDCYRDEEDIKETFQKFIDKLPFYGRLVCCIDDAGVRDVLKSAGTATITYGLEKSADYRARDMTYTGHGSSFVLVCSGTKPGSVSLALAGVHNIRNSLAAIAVADLMAVSREVTMRVLANFKGVERRFQLKAEVNGVAFIDDYAHHPTEISSVLESARNIAEKRVIAVFQPHLYSRTRDFYRDFGLALNKAHLAIVTDIYPAREKPIAGISSALIVDSAPEKIHYIADEDEVISFLLDTIESGDMVITMGAGDIWHLNEKLIKCYKNNG
jgi:UDP-N-acetylmuramate--alanine ligase